MFASSGAVGVEVRSFELFMKWFSDKRVDGREASRPKLSATVVSLWQDRVPDLHGGQPGGVLRAGEGQACCSEEGCLDRIATKDRALRSARDFADEQRSLRRSASDAQCLRSAVRVHGSDRPGELQAQSLDHRGSQDIPPWDPGFALPDPMPSLTEVR